MSMHSISIGYYLNIGCNRRMDCFVSQVHFYFGEDCSAIRAHSGKMYMNNNGVEKCSLTISKRNCTEQYIILLTSSMLHYIVTLAVNLICIFSNEIKQTSSSSHILKMINSFVTIIKYLYKMLLRNTRCLTVT